MSAIKQDSRPRTGRKRGNGEGNIRLRADGRWEARFTLPDGKRKSFFGRTRKEAADELARAQADVRRGLPLPSGRLTLGRFLDDWLREWVAPSSAPKTHKDYSQIVKNHIAPAMGRSTLDQVTPQRIQALLNAKQAAGKSARTVQYIHAVLRAALNEAFRQNLVARNAALLARPPRVTQREVLAITPADARAILAAFGGHPLGPLVMATLTLGLRQGEALALRWSDLDLDAGRIDVRDQLHQEGGRWTFRDLKTKRSRRTLVLPDFLVTALRQHRTQQLEQRLGLGSLWADLNLVFPGPTGLPLNGTRVTKRFQEQMQRAGLERMRFHDLRHGAASLMLAQGASLREIMEVLGHSTITITANFYTHIAPEMKREIAGRMHAALAGAGG